MTSHRNALSWSGVQNAINTLAHCVKLTCQEPDLLSILDLNLHNAAISMVFSITGILPECSLIILFILG